MSPSRHQDLVKFLISASLVDTHSPNIREHCQIFKYTVRLLIAEPYKVQAAWCLIADKVRRGRLEFESSIQFLIDVEYIYFQIVLENKYYYLIL